MVTIALLVVGGIAFFVLLATIAAREYGAAAISLAIVVLCSGSIWWLYNWKWAHTTERACPIVSISATENGTPVVLYEDGGCVLAAELGPDTRIVVGPRTELVVIKPPRRAWLISPTTVQYELRLPAVGFDTKKQVE